MPKQRFFNLAKEKQERIIDSAIDAFAEKGFNADVASIVRGAKIPRGSFYQYFNGIEDLFTYILELIIQTKYEYLSDLLNLMGKIPFIDFFRKAFERGLEFAEDYPKYRLIGAHLSSPGGDKLGFIEMRKKSGESLYATLIEKDKEKGLIRKDVDAMLLGKLLYGISSEIAIEKLYREHKTIEEILETLDGFFDIIINGIKP